MNQISLLIVGIFSLIQTMDAQDWGGTSKPLIHYYTSTESSEWIDLTGDLIYENFSPDQAVVMALHCGGQLHTDSCSIFMQNFEASIGDFYFNGKKMDVDSVNLNNNIELVQQHLDNFAENNLFELEIWGEFIEEPDVMTTNANFYVKEEVTIENEIYGGPFFIQQGISSVTNQNLDCYNHAFRFSFQEPFGYLFDFLPVGYIWDPLLSWGNGEFTPDISLQDIYGGSKNLENLNSCYILSKKDNGKFIPLVVDCIPLADPCLSSSISKNEIEELDFKFYATSNEINVTFNHEKNIDSNLIEIYDLVGRRVCTQKINHNQQNIRIDISHLTPSSYLLKISGTHHFKSVLFNKI